MAKNKWTSRALPEKYMLAAGIIEWVAKKTDIENARLPTLDRLNVEDLELLAIAVGYKPGAHRIDIIKARFARDAENARLREVYAAERAIARNPETTDAETPIQ